MTRCAARLVSGFAAQLARAFRNLVDNAVRHAHTTVLVGCAALDDTAARVVIGDDGPGVPAAERARVFERFVRLNADRGRSTRTSCTRRP